MKIRMQQGSKNLIQDLYATPIILVKFYGCEWAQWPVLYGDEGYNVSLRATNGVLAVLGGGRPLICVI